MGAKQFLAKTLCKCGVHTGVQMVMGLGDMNLFEGYKTSCCNKYLPLYLTPFYFYPVWVGPVYKMPHWRQIKDSPLIQEYCQSRGINLKGWLNGENWEE